MSAARQWKAIEEEEVWVGDTQKREAEREGGTGRNALSGRSGGPCTGCWSPAAPGISRYRNEGLIERSCK
ncbi:similar to An02g14160 [Aspergillus luchuensis]|uniref:Similar to An02g14160 n=1 Tax=Aspergillus kawachii TaxID=1069201 RepID=A0A146FLJ7_ASPKA|nr:similar to An02g14160 [Aspergillus luchuensis]